MKTLVTSLLLCLMALLGCSATGSSKDKPDAPLVVQETVLGKLPPRTFVLRASDFQSPAIGTNSGSLFSQALGEIAEDAQVSDTDGDGRVSLHEIKSFVDDFYSTKLDASRSVVSYAISSVPDVALLSQDALSTADKPRRKLVAVLVGIGKYQTIRSDIPGVDEDIKHLTALLTSDKLLVSESKIHVLQNEQATYVSILEALDWLKETATEEDLVVFYFSGHAALVPRSGQDSPPVFTLAPYDAVVASNRTVDRGLETRDLLERLGEVLAEVRVVFIDD